MGAHYGLNARECDPIESVLDLTNGLGVDVAVEAVGGAGSGIVQALGMVGHNGILAIYGDNYAPVREFCFHRFHEDGLEVRNLNAVHYTRLRAVDHMREAYRAVERGAFDLSIVFENSVTHSLDDIASVFQEEAEALDEQASLKTIILP
jgi:threonine dehydrogenase-like Zn-dependent dehydrogenase